MKTRRSNYPPTSRTRILRNGPLVNTVDRTIGASGPSDPSGDTD